MELSYNVVDQFEQTVAQYTGSKYAVAVDSCTNALFLSCYACAKSYHTITIPSKTYWSVPCSIINAGNDVDFDDIEWSGIYRLKPTNIYDAAKRFRKDMYIKDSIMCLSFHYKKHLPIGKGGMILTDNDKLNQWFRKARHCGRKDGPYTLENINFVGWNMYMTAEQAARGLTLMENVSDFNEDLYEDYPDLSQMRNLI